jgi:oligoribonuclease (3'-5' exoribonuclease)
MDCKYYLYSTTLAEVGGTYCGEPLFPKEKVVEIVQKKIEKCHNCQFIVSDTADDKSLFESAMYCKDAYLFVRIIFINQKGEVHRKWKKLFELMEKKHYHK